MTTSMTIRMDPEIKKEAQELFRSLGLDMTTAINLFLRQSLMHRGLPFAVRQPRPRHHITAIGGMTRAELDAELQKGVDSMKAGKVYTADEVDAELRREFGI
ncbi:type II toxin-antitoxin system RelB/DinJ family antitoxin [uncultured Selenomonas sp.]|uniref:type II toxin-antitoxin system RelB/DinJ family antitoxin n=1 Tax=uncultured Selenomonas sp. TaxID=159275 RepID=UPI0025D3D0EF|nr:type II toxin-antitoxin system RelB/DinJ family antitoxin [uncultured Selenomonas sp.]